MTSTLYPIDLTLISFSRIDLIFILVLSLIYFLICYIGLSRLVTYFGGRYQECYIIVAGFIHLFHYTILRKSVRRLYYSLVSSPEFT